MAPGDRDATIAPRRRIIDLFRSHFFEPV